MKKYSSYKDSGVEWIGEIPNHWKYLPLKFFFNYTKGSSGQKLTKTYIEENKGDYPVYSGMTENEGILGYVDEYEFNYPFPLIFTTTVGSKFMSTKIVEGKFSLSQNCLVMIKTKNISVRFVEYFLLYDFLFRRELIPRIFQPSLRMEDLDQYQILVPPLPEQKKIVSFLDEKTSKIDRLIQSKQRKIDLLKEKRTALINKSVTKGLNPEVEMKDSGVEWIGTIPSHWHSNKLKYVCEILPSNVDKNVYPEENQVRLCNYTDVYYNDYLRNDYKFSEGSCDNRELEKFSLIKGDVIITKDSESPNDIGIPTYIDDTLNNVVCGYHLTMIRCHSIIGKYLFRFIQSNLTKSYFKVNSYGITRYGLGKSSIENLVVPIPPEEEQNEIVAYLDSETQTIDKTIFLEEKKIEILKEYKQSIISEVVTGKINVQEEVLV